MAIVRYTDKYKFIINSNTDKILGNHVIFEGDLVIRGMNMYHLPKYLEVRGNFFCDDNYLELLPERLKIYGSFNCSENKIKKLPKNLYIGGNFSCIRNLLTSFPDDMKVMKSVYCDGNKISKPILSSIGGKIYMDDKQIKWYDRIMKLDRIVSKMKESKALTSER